MSKAKQIWEIFVEHKKADDKNDRELWAATVIRSGVRRESAKRRCKTTQNKQQNGQHAHTS